jgi:hypothetical protein
MGFNTKLSDDLNDCPLTLKTSIHIPYESCGQSLMVDKKYVVLVRILLSIYNQHKGLNYPSSWGCIIIYIKD